MASKLLEDLRREFDQKGAPSDIVDKYINDCSEYAKKTPSELTRILMSCGVALAEHGCVEGLLYLKMAVSIYMIETKIVETEEQNPDERNKT